MKKLLYVLIILVCMIPPACGGSGSTTVCPSGCDYTTLSAWEAAEQGDLTGTGPAIVTITSGFEDTARLIITGWTTTAADYILITTNSTARHPGNFSDSAYYLNVTGSAAIYNYEDYVRIDGLQVHSSVSECYRQLNVNTGEERISNNIFIGPGSSYTNTVSGSTGNNGILKIWNNVVYDSTGSSSVAIRSACSENSGSVYIYSNTISNTTLGIRQAGTATTRVFAKNNLINATNTFVGTFNSTSNNNSVSDGTATGGSHDRVSQTFNFTNVSNDDYHLKSDDTGALGYGTNMSADADLSFSDDIDGDIRSGAWDIGADEYTEDVPSSGFVIPNLVWYYTFLIGDEAMTVAEIKASMDADGLDCWEVYRWTGTAYATTGDVEPCEGLTVYCNNTGEWNI